MKGSLFTCLTTLLLIGFTAVAESQGMTGGGGMGMMACHHQFMTGGVPEPYRLLTNPLPENAGVISRGRAIYRDHCASCHGPSGLGDGEAGRELSPRPANLAWLSRMPMMMDDSYL